MKVIAISGSPRKNNNTGILLSNALDGAKSIGAETELINLYDLNYKGCKSCFACKLKNGKSYGKCVCKDELSPILEKILSADAIILGSPIYFQSLTGEMRSFLERLMFPLFTYTEGYKSLLAKKIPVGLICSMNVMKDVMIKNNYTQVIKFVEDDLKLVFGECESLIVNDTLQFDDYSKYVVTVFDENEKRKVREKQFPIDCKGAFNMGVSLVIKAKKLSKIW